MILPLQLLVVFLLILGLDLPPLRAELVFVNPGDPGTTEGHPARRWEDAEKTVVAEAVREWQQHIRGFDGILGRWTLRWEDDSLFRDLRTSGGGDDLSGVPAVTIRPGDWERLKFPSPPKDSADFPEREIYFNVFSDFSLWFIDPTPTTDDPNEPPNTPTLRQIDFLTVVTHELGHALGIQGHLPDGSVAVMEEKISPGEARHRIDPLDILFIKSQGGELAKALITPEPSTTLLFVLSAVALGAGARRRRRRST